jgi:hypothetical protein
MNVLPTIKPQKPSLVKWMIKHKVSTKLMSTKFAVRKAIIHEQLKHELK